jgi:hypothetical protein
VLGKKVAQRGGFAVTDQFPEVGYQERMSHRPASRAWDGHVGTQWKLFARADRAPDSEKIPTRRIWRDPMRNEIT